ncbi:MAG: hypothetical protein M3Z13_07915 [Candidatus Dormibacteraeota bacterium]|nr:hypothetical protein [Candidatus Dormibacteraeota bacterium]
MGMGELYENANDAIWTAFRRAERQRAEQRRLPALINAIDELLFELEELNVQGVDRVPVDLRQKSSSVLRLIPTSNPEEVRVRYRVGTLMNTLFHAQELVFRARDPQRPLFDEADGMDEFSSD